MNLEDLDQERDTLAGLLAELHAVFDRYVALPSNQARDALVLWCAATHAQSVADNAPRLVIKAPEKRCGKSRCLDIVESVSFNPVVAVNATPAAIFRSIEAEQPPTLIFDEVDTIFGKGRSAEDDSRELRGLLNAGHQRGRPARRVIGKGTEQSVTEFPTFAMAALAGIGDMPDTIEDRAVVVTMRRRTPGEKVEKFRYRRDQLPLHALRDRLTRCVAEHLESLGEAEPELPVEDRAADTWEPLIALADAAGDTWPHRARRAATTLTQAHEDTDTDASIGVRLLTDCRTVFADQGHPTALKSADLLTGLKNIPEAPWAEWGRSNNGLTTRGLSDLLRRYGITSANIDFAPARADRAKGYQRQKFTDAWARYCPTEEPESAGEPYPPYHAHHPSAHTERINHTARNDPYHETTRTTLTSNGDSGTPGTPPTTQHQPVEDPCADCGTGPIENPTKNPYCRTCQKRRTIHVA